METAPTANPVVIETDLPCAICGYNLKGLASDANCPECGQAVARTFTPDLSRSDPKWLRHQANTMLLLGALCLVNYQPYRYLRGWDIVRMVLSLAAAATAVWACWRLSTPEPPGPAPDGDATRLRALRVTPIIFTAIAIGSLFSDRLNTTVWSISSLTAEGSLIATNALVAWFLYRLARRSNNPLLILHARVVMWSFPLSQASNLIIGVIGLVVLREDSNREWIYAFLGLLDWVLRISVYVALLLMGRMYEVLGSAARSVETRQVDAVAG